MQRHKALTRTIHAQGVPGVVTTDEHPIYTRKSTTTYSRSTKTINRTCGYRVWKEAKHINTSHYLAQVLPPPREDPNPPSFWWLIGRYLANGFRTDPAQVYTGTVVLFGTPEDPLQPSKHIVAANLARYTTSQPGEAHYTISNDHFHHLTGTFGNNPHSNTIPKTVLELPQPQAKAFMDGYLAAKNPRTPNKPGSMTTATVTSKAFALGLALMAQRAYGIVASITSHTIPSPRKSANLPQNRISWTLRVPLQNSTALTDHQYGWKRVSKNAPTGRTETVWNLTVDEDQSYVADGAIVHNCEPFSKAGVSKNNSLGRPHGFADQTRGTLFFQIVRILATHRPRTFLLENVPHILHHDQGRTYGTVKSLLEQELGYTTSHRIINARPWVPQHRRRIFIVGHRQPDQPSLNNLELPDEHHGPILSDILHPQDGSEAPELPYTQEHLATVADKYTLGPGTWNTLLNHRERHGNAGNGFGYTIADPAEPTRTLTARYGKDGQEILIPQDERNPRKLTPRECARLMGMPKLIIPVSDTQAYRQLGHSVVPPLVETIAAQIMA